MASAEITSQSDPEEKPATLVSDLEDRQTMELISAETEDNCEAHSGDEESSQYTSENNTVSEDDAIKEQNHSINSQTLERKTDNGNGVTCQGPLS